jgi:hypothetical protein
MTQQLTTAVEELDDTHNPVVFKDDNGQWKVLRFGPFHEDAFDTWAEAYAFAYWHTRISNVLIDVFGGADCG